MWLGADYLDAEKSSELIEAHRSPAVHSALLAHRRSDNLWIREAADRTLNAIVRRKAGAATMLIAQPSQPLSTVAGVGRSVYDW
jgi:hypothetical protein